MSSRATAAPWRARLVPPAPPCSRRASPRPRAAAATQTRLISLHAVVVGHAAAADGLLAAVGERGTGPGRAGCGSSPGRSRRPSGRRARRSRRRRSAARPGARGRRARSSTSPAASSRSTVPIASTRRSCCARRERADHAPGPRASLRASSSARSARPAARERGDAAAAVGRVRRDRDEPVGLQPAQQPAQVARVEPQAAAQLAHLAARRADLPQHARRAERAAEAEEPGLERAGALGDGAVEAADARDRRRTFPDCSQRIAAKLESPP